MGATRKRTRSCSDSMRDPNCPRLRQCAAMFPELGQVAVSEPCVPRVALTRQGEDMPVSAALQLLDCPRRVLEAFSEHGERRIGLVREFRASEELVGRQRRVCVLHRRLPCDRIWPYINPPPASTTMSRQDVVGALVDLGHTVLTLLPCA